MTNHATDLSSTSARGIVESCEHESFTVEYTDKATTK